MSKKEIKELIDNYTIKIEPRLVQGMLKKLLLEALILDSDNVIKKMGKL